MRVLKYALFGILALAGTQATAAPNIQTTTVIQDEVTELSGAEYSVYMRKMNVIQKIIEQGNPVTQEFMEAMNEAQGSINGADIPHAPDKKTTVRIYTDYQTLVDDPNITDDVKNMMLSDYGLSINSDFTKVPPLDGKIYIDDFLANIAVERTANAYSTEPQPALVSMNGLFEEHGMEDMVAESPDEKYAKMLKGEADTGFGFITKAHAKWYDLDKSKVKTESQRNSFSTYIIETTDGQVKHKKRLHTIKASEFGHDAVLYGLSLGTMYPLFKARASMFGTDWHPHEDYKADFR